MNAGTPERMGYALGRRRVHPPVDMELANMPPADRGLYDFNTRSMMDLDPMQVVNNPRVMSLARRQQGNSGNEWVSRDENGDEDEHRLRDTPDTRARKNEKDSQKWLRRQN
jgi:hypothetical protein